MKRTWIRRIIGGLSCTTALFVFQACYGTGQDFGIDVTVEGTVISEKTKKPLKGIKVSVEDNVQYDKTDENGKFYFYTDQASSLKIKFEDVDGESNGVYISQDSICPGVTEKLHLDIVMKENEE